MLNDEEFLAERTAFMANLSSQVEPIVKPFQSSQSRIIDDNTIPYYQYHLTAKFKMLHLRDQSSVNDSLRAELARCKQEMVSLERNKVKHDLDQTIIERNEQNAELEEENVLLKSKLSQNVESINSLKN
ncbi:hypothetical protein Tco_0652603 [Tanacetum coccineum]|uniref:Protein CASP n=1 Tax=Tanacetum coccineum TaxID=301880 RepID=A0ABQ4WY31_9ASTR